MLNFSYAKFVEKLTKRSLSVPTDRFLGSRPQLYIRVCVCDRFERLI